jgi:hypothetical protein
MRDLERIEHSVPPISVFYLRPNLCTLFVVNLEPYGRGGIDIDFSLPLTSYASEVDELLVSTLSFMLGIAPDAM